MASAAPPHRGRCGGRRSADAAPAGPPRRGAWGPAARSGTQIADGRLRTRAGCGSKYTPCRDHTGAGNPHLECRAGGKGSTTRGHRCLGTDRIVSWAAEESREVLCFIHVMWSQPVYLSTALLQLGQGLVVSFTFCVDACSPACWLRVRCSKRSHVSPLCQGTPCRTHALRRHSWHRAREQSAG